MIQGAVMVPHPPLILPEVGRGEEKIIADTTNAYLQAAQLVAELKPDTIVLASPHSVMYRDYIHISPGRQAVGDMGMFRAPQVKFKVEYDSELAAAISDLAAGSGLSAGMEGETDPHLDHGTMVPLYFINKYWHDYKLVRIGLSMLRLQEHYRLGQLIQKAAAESGRRVVFVASGDLSHKLQSYGPYGFAEEGPEYDRRVMDACGSGRFDLLFDFSEDFCTRAAECGHRSFVMMAGALDGLSLSIKKLSHQDVTGVGYGICTYIVTGADETRRFLKKGRDQ